ncbi:MAG: pyridoxal phosphate-dependent aminotransferase, partial [Nitrospinota bacterium]
MREAEISRDQHGGNVWHLAERLGLPVAEILDFSASINPLGPPKGVREALKKALSEVIHYPEPTYKRLRQAICRYLGAPGLTPLHILVGNGSSELLHFIPPFLKARRIAFPAPAFSEYERSARAAGANALKFMGNPGDGFAPREEELAQAARRAELLFLANPQNPQGTLLRAELLELALKEAERSRCWVVLDEAFMDFLPEPLSQSLVERACLGKKVLVVRSFTKIFALPGLRLGYLVGSEKLIQSMMAARAPWTVNSLAQAAALAAME